MTSVALLLLVVLCASELNATGLNDTVLTRIVKDFRSVRDENKDQFSFLIALDPRECASYQDNLYLNGGKRSNLPSISKTPDDFNVSLNYMAVYPDKGHACSEYKILFKKRERERVSEWFGKNIKVLLHGGCVIFYTENTPCTYKCFSGKPKTDIAAPILSNPFDSWRTDGDIQVHKYFVYGEVYDCDKETNKPLVIHHFQCMDEFAVDPHSSFLFRRCQENLLCRHCDRQNDYCVKL
ncbi:uncharacterized protein LOC119958453 [Scyliorhinus canicula]|uniref:uncharacterized protein LOC119958453 n=1 Tax=Scyliorhinus canicula TaxID=7830 RepID=UPI0018F31AFB|nr:uncharacterized protein LOC119958453 [Scyliorhinus canicula]XP_038642923.1 uncharacterized protein LOC119958453 [Scyliorhinus canicula]